MKKATGLFLAAALAYGCGGGDSSSPVSSDPPPPVEVPPDQSGPAGQCEIVPPESPPSSGEVNGITPGYRGRFIGQVGIGVGSMFGRLRQARVTATLDDGTQLGPAFTDGSGLVTINPGPNYQGGIRIQFEAVDETYYFDEARCRDIKYPAGERLRAHVEKITPVIAVTPLTEAAVRLAEAASLSPIQANDAVRDTLNRLLPDSFRLESITDEIPSGSRPFRVLRELNPHARYAALIAGVAYAAVRHNPSLIAPGLSIGRQLVDDLADGRIDGAKSDGTSLAHPTEIAYVASELRGQLTAGIQSTFALGGVSAYIAVGTYRFSREYSATSDSRGVLHILPGFSFDPNLSFKVSDVSAVYSDGDVMFIRKTDDTMHVAGANPGNGFLRFGQASPDGFATPSPIPALDGIVAIAQGPEHYLGLRADGSVVGWGRNSNGKIGSPFGPGMFANPVRVEGFDFPAKAVAASRDASFALLTDGRVMSKGYRWTGQVQDLSGVAGLVVLASDPPTPLDRVVSIAATSDTVVALRTDGSVWAWGGDTYITQTDAPSPHPVRIDGLSNITKIVRMKGGMVALDAEGQIFHWGRHPSDGSRRPVVLLPMPRKMSDIQERGGENGIAIAFDRFAYFLGDPGFSVR